MYYAVFMNASFNTETAGVALINAILIMLPNKRYKYRNQYTYYT